MLKKSILLITALCLAGNSQVSFCKRVKQINQIITKKIESENELPENCYHQYTSDDGQEFYCCKKIKHVSTDKKIIFFSEEKALVYILEKKTKVNPTAPPFEIRSNNIDTSGYASLKTKETIITQPAITKGIPFKIFPAPPPQINKPSFFSSLWNKTKTFCTKNRILGSITSIILLKKLKKPIKNKLGNTLSYIKSNPENSIIVGLAGAGIFVSLLPIWTMLRYIKKNIKITRHHYTNGSIYYNVTG